MPLSSVMRIKKLFGGLKKSFNESKRLTNEAAKEMDKRYPQGWAQNSAKMAELRMIRKNLKK